MRETSIMDNLNCKMQAHSRVCRENKSEEKCITIKYIFIERSSIWYYSRNIKEIDFSVFTCDDAS